MLLIPPTNDSSSHGFLFFIFIFFNHFYETRTVFQLYTTLTVPDFEIKEYFPEILDGLFKALEDQSAAVREITITVLTEMQHKLNPKKYNKSDVHKGLPNNKYFF